KGPDGFEASTPEAKVEVSRTWSVSGISAPATAAAGSKVSYSAKVSGSASGLTYNYVWRYGTGWSDWGSTSKGTGKYTSSASGSFTPTKAGTYYLWVDVKGPDGFEASTPEAKVEVSGYAIMGASGTTAAQMARFYRATVGDAYPSNVYSEKGAATLDDFCTIVYEEAEREGVKAEVLFAQAMHETGWLRFGGSVKAQQCNFGGLGAVSSTAAGATFSSVRIGLRAQAQHLKAYGSTQPLNSACVDPRFSLVARGSALTVEDLGGKWAVPGTNYGTSIVSLINRLKTA
ncbi:glucosaminidase domain-containing protein, partial [Eggerthella sinensis]